MSGVYTVAHLSDLHFARLAGWRNPLSEEEPTLVKAVRFLNSAVNAGIHVGLHPSTYRERVALELAHHIARQRTEAGSPKFDIAIITGDLATTGDDCGIASRYLDGALQFSLRQSIPTRYGPVSQAANQGVIVMPGNHDRYFSFPFFPGSRTFEAEFLPTWTKFTAAGVFMAELSDQGFVSTFAIAKADSILAIVCCDLSLDGPHSGGGELSGWLGQGRASRRKLARLGELLREVPNALPGSATILCIHYVPDCRLEPADMRLVGAVYFGKLCEDAGVRLILCGHTHEAKVFPLGADSGPWVIVAGSATSYGGDGVNSYWALDLRVTNSELEQFRVRRAVWQDLETDFHYVGPGGFSWRTMSREGFLTK